MKQQILDHGHIVKYLYMCTLTKKFPLSYVASLPVKSFPENSADPIQSNWIRTRIQVPQTESDDPQIMPENVVVLLSARIEVEEEHESMVW